MPSRFIELRCGGANHPYYLKSTVNAGITIDYTTSKVKIYAYGALSEQYDNISIYIEDTLVASELKSGSSYSFFSTDNPTINHEHTYYLGEYTLPANTNGKTSIIVKITSNTSIDKSPLKVFCLFHFNNDKTIYGFLPIKKNSGYYGYVVPKLYEPSYITFKGGNNSLQISTENGIKALNLVSVENADTGIRVQCSDGIKGVKTYVETTSETKTNMQEVDDYGADYVWDTQLVLLGGYNTYPIVFTNPQANCIEVHLSHKLNSTSNSSYLNRNWYVYVYNGSSWYNTGQYVYINEFDVYFHINVTFTARTLHKVALVPNGGTSTYSQSIIPNHLQFTESYTAQH